MKNILLGALAFAVCAIVPGLALSAAATLSLPRGVPPRPDPTGDLLMVLIYYGTTTGVRTLGFVVPTVFSPAWRRLSTRRVLVVAGVLGLTSPMTSLLGLALIVKAVLPLFHSAPWLAIWLSNGVPGLLLGLIAVLIASAWRSPQSA